MFCNKPKSVNRSVPGKKNRKRKRKPTYPQSDNKLRKPNQSPLNIAQAMSTWAQDYTAATTWQLKHEVAYWKSRAIALQYENKILHEMIRDQHFQQTPKTTCNKHVADGLEPNEEFDNDDEDDKNEKHDEHYEIEDDDEQHEIVDDDEHYDIEEDDENVNGDEENDNFEVSEEFIEFLKQNAKYKEDARRERDLLNAKVEAETLEALAQEEKLESSEEKQARLIKLYGDNWEKILALETSVLCTFISECDKEQPEYWPNIPFNFASY